MADELTPSQPALPTAAAEDLLARWLATLATVKSRKSYLDRVAHFARWAGHARPAEALARFLALTAVQADTLAEQYRADQLAGAAATSSVANRLSALRSLVRFARRKGHAAWSLDTPSPRVQQYRDTSGPTLEQWQRLRARAQSEATTAHGKRNLAALFLLRDSAFRVGEVAALDVADLVLDDDPPHVWRRLKGQRDPVKWTVNTRTAAALDAWLFLRGRELGPLFVALDTSTKYARSDQLARWTEPAIAQWLDRLRERAGLRRKLTPHQLRHAGITRAKELEPDLFKVQGFSAHKKVETVLVYAKRLEDHAGELAERLGAD